MFIISISIQPPCYIFRMETTNHEKNHSRPCTRPAAYYQPEFPGRMPSQKTHKGWIYPPPTQQSWQNESVLGIGFWNPLETSQKNVMQNIPPIVVTIGMLVFWVKNPSVERMDRFSSIIRTFHFPVSRCFGSSSSTNSSGTGQLSRVGVGWLVGTVGTVGGWRFSKILVPNWGAKNGGNALQMGC